jgi:shikimate kinase
MAEGTKKVGDGGESLKEARVAPRRIVLTGFMGSGKTTCGKILADRIGWRFIDVDLFIESATGMKIAEIFLQSGEATFREMEEATIVRLLSEEAIVLALGGGAIENESVRARLNEAGTLLVHLEVSLETTLVRCKVSEGTRPVLADQKNLADRYQRRLPLYRGARINLNVDSLTPHAVVEKILKSTEF